jgi:hypothetical protein
VTPAAAPKNIFYFFFFWLGGASARCCPVFLMLWDNNGRLRLVNVFMRCFVGLVGGNIDAPQHDVAVDERCQEIVVGAGGHVIPYHARLIEEGEGGEEVELEVVQGTCTLVRGRRGTSLVSRPPGIVLRNITPTTAALIPAMETAGWDGSAEHYEDLNPGGKRWVERGDERAHRFRGALAHACTHWRGATQRRTTTETAALAPSR